MQGVPFDKLRAGFRLRHALRFAGRVSPLRTTALIFELGAERIARQELLAAKAPSPSLAGGSWAVGRACQVRPSSVRRRLNFSFPDSSGMGLPGTMPCGGPHTAVESKKALGLVVVN